MHHLHAGQSATRHTEGAHALADRQLLRLRGIEVQETQDQRAAVLVLHGHPQLAAAAEHTSAAAVTTASTCASSPSRSWSMGTTTVSSS